MPAICTIKFSADAYDWAAATYTKLAGLTVKVTPAEGEPFLAVIESVTDGYERDDGQFLATLALADSSGAPTHEKRTLNIYGDIKQVEVV